MPAWVPTALGTFQQLLSCACLRLALWAWKGRSVSGTPGGWVEGGGARVGGQVHVCTLTPARTQPQGPRLWSRRCLEDGAAAEGPSPLVSGFLSLVIPVQWRQASRQAVLLFMLCGIWFGPLGCLWGRLG